MYQMNKSIYTVLSLLNFGALAYLTNMKPTLAIVIFYFGVLVNQIFLVLGVKALINAQKKSFLLVIKFFVLAAVFVYAMQTMPNHLIICLATYKFQLIILAISIKSDSKKN